jgi:endonuclease YncB( thermonuclease family)
MTRYFYIRVCALFALLFSAGNVGAWEGIVVKVIDGDSLQVRHNGKIHEIRLYGIDTPEYRQAYSNKAKQFTRRLAHRQVVTVEEKDVDRYGRIVALVVSRGKLVNRELVREGLDWYYPKYCRDQPLCGELKRLEGRSRKERRGIWQDENPVPPWEWKRRRNSAGSKPQAGWYNQLLDRL